MLLFWLVFTVYPGFCDKNLQSHYSEPSNRSRLSSLSMINDPHEFPFGFIYVFIYLVLHIYNAHSLEYPGLSKEKLLAIHLLAIYKSSSSQLPLYLPLNVLSALFLTNILHLISPPLWPLFLLAKSQLSNCCLCQLSWACVQDLRQHMILKKCVLVREPLLFLAYN